MLSLPGVFGVACFDNLAYYARSVVINLYIFTLCAAFQCFTLYKLVHCVLCIAYGDTQSSKIEVWPFAWFMYSLLHTNKQSKQHSLFITAFLPT